MSIAMKSALVVLAGGLICGGAAQGAELKQIAEIPITLDAPLAQFDISWISPETNTYLLTSAAARDRKVTANPGNNGLLVIDAKTNKFEKIIPGMRGSGVVSADHGREAWIGDGGGTIDVVNIKTGKVQTIPTGANQGGGDELTYDPKDDLIAAALPDNDPPTLILIKRATRKIVARIPLPGATDGMEQTVYEPRDGMFWVAIPEFNHDEKKGGEMEVNPKTLKEVGVKPVANCNPHGNALANGDNLYLGCHLQGHQAVFNIKTGAVTDVPGVGGTDETAVDHKLGLYYSAASHNSGGAVLAVVDAKTNQIVQQIPTKGNAHSVAVDPNNHHVFVPEAGSGGGCGCIRVFAPEM